MFNYNCTQRDGNRAQGPGPQSGRALFESVGAIHWVWTGLAGTVRVLGQSECARIPALAKRGVVSYTYVEKGGCGLCKITSGRPISGFGEKQ